MTADDLVIGRTHARFQGRRFACATGKNGLTHHKSEGDGATPIGTHGLVGCLFRPDRLARPNDWAVPIRPGDLWSDDPKDEDYNLLVRAPYAPSHEVLRRPDPLYDLILLTNWNWPYAKRGAGSAIFLHVWRKPRHPTEGCITFAKPDLLWIAARIKHQTRLIVQP